MFVVKKLAAVVLMLTIAGAASAGNGDIIVPKYALECSTDLMCATKVVNASVRCLSVADSQEEAEGCRQEKAELMKLCTVCLPVNISFERARLPLP